MGMAHKVYFTGYISDEELLKLYKCVDVAVFPSLYEPFGIVALEGWLQMFRLSFPTPEALERLWNTASTA